MKNRQHNFGVLFVIIGVFLLFLWGYQKWLHRNEFTQMQNIAQNQNVRADIMNPNPTFQLGMVELSVQNLDKMKSFYHDIVGLDIESNSGNTLTLGENGRPLLTLIEEKNFTFAPKNEAGLYHIAITHTSRKELALRVKNILEKSPERYEGSADHSATEAFYFSDPEGNGLELYYDKPRKDWTWVDGKPTLGTYPLDTPNYIERFSDAPTSFGSTRMGHVHLKVGNIEEAKKFYIHLLGFEEISDLGNALFVSRDKYHHHIGLNTWETLGSEKKGGNRYGLRSFEMQFASTYIYEQVYKNLLHSTSGVQVESGKVFTTDPWGNKIYLSQFDAMK